MTESVLNPYAPTQAPPLQPVGGVPAPPLVPPGTQPPPPPPFETDNPPAWQGPPGPAGPPGADSTVPGPPGPQGVQGPPGAKGDQGDQGVQGPPGGAPAWQGEWSASVDYASNDAVSLSGSSYYAAGDPGLGVSPPSAPWQQIAAKGDTGATGPPGPQGATGAQGPTGAQGIQGPQGNTGSQGPAGPGVPVGGTTGQALLKNSATDFDASWQTETVAYPLLAPNGSASAPSYSFSATTGTGMWSSAAATIVFATAGSSRLRITNTGLQAFTDGAVDIGASGANRIRNIYQTSFTEIAEIATPATPPAGSVRIYAKADHGLYLLDSTGAERRLDVVTLEGTKSYA